MIIVPGPAHCVLNRFIIKTLKSGCMLNYYRYKKISPLALLGRNDKKKGLFSQPLKINIPMSYLNVCRPALVRYPISSSGLSVWIIETPLSRYLR